jgi:uncharacterized membrane protein YedE/YeeE
MEHFTPYAALLGGSLIGLSACLLLLATGRIAGISGIVAGLLVPTPDGKLWRALFVAGLVAGCLATRMAAPDGTEVVMIASAPSLAIAGLLVGFGTRVANGCTSGHGVCGIARLSPRSIAATITFMVSGALTVFVVRHVVGS